jgi:RHS repeat-associated protein
MNDMYSYSQAGLPTAKRLQVIQPIGYLDENNHLQQSTMTTNLDSGYGYNGEGKITSMSYPSTGTAGPSYNYSYDSMYRLSGMTDSSNNTIVSNVSYNAANQLLTMNYPTGDETRVYNTLGQLSNLYVQSPPYFSYAVNLTYNYPTGTNNGKASSMYNAISGETVTYAYDSLNRLLTANGSGWGQQYGFDGFGNLLSKTVTAGSGPSLSQAVNTANNQIVGQSYDANGNLYAAYNGGQTYSLRYDGENRMISATTEAGTYVDYGYDAQNRRIWSWPGAVDGVGNTTNYTVNVYSPSGQKLGAYLFTPSAMGYEGQIIPIMVVTLSSSDQYFGGRRLAPMDQLGSVVNSSQAYFPWGETKGTSNPQDTWNFATYWQDSNTGLDYANNRYYSNAYGRFMTPDPYKASGGHGTGKPGDPQSWNRYAYTRGDPVNRFDPNGTDDSGTGDGGDGGDPNGGDTSSFTCDTSWESDASLVGTPCGIQVPGPYGGMVYINIAAIVAAAEAEAAALAAQQNGPQCFAQLKTRPVDDPTAQTFGGTHSFWYIQTSTGQQYILSGGPTGAGSGYLNVYTSTNVTSGVDNTSATTSWSSGLSSTICNQVDAMLSAAQNFPNNTIQYNPVTSNSNTAAHYLGTQGNFYPPPPPGSAGWNYGLFGSPGGP